MVGSQVCLWNLDITSKTTKSMEAAEMWFYHSIHRIPWTPQQTYVTFLLRKGQEHKLLCCIEQKQLKFLCQIIHEGGLEDLALCSWIPVKCARGAHHFTFINNIKCLYENSGSLSITDQIGKQCYISHYIKRSKILKIHDCSRSLTIWPEWTTSA